MLTKVLAGLTIAGSVLVASAAAYYGIQSLNPTTGVGGSDVTVQPTSQDAPSCCPLQRSCCGE